MSTTGSHSRKRHNRDRTVVNTRSTHGRAGFDPVPFDPFYNSVSDYEMIASPELPAGIIDGSTHIMPGSLPASSFDTTPPADPTGLLLDSDVVSNSDGTSFVRLLITIDLNVTDTDLLETLVQVTGHSLDGGITPTWDRPLTMTIPAGEVQARVDDVQGASIYWARAIAVDILGNYSAWTSNTSHTTTGDNDAPPVPQAVTLVSGFRGFSASWTGSGTQDLSFYQMRWAVDLSGAPDTDQWVYGNANAQVTFIPNLEPDVTYWFQVRGIDTSKNVQTSTTDTTAVNYETYPEAGWSDAVSVVPSAIGQQDIGAGEIYSVHIQTGELDAAKIGTGTLRVNTGLSSTADGIQVVDSDGVVLGQWDENGLFIKESASMPQRVVFLDGGELKFSTDGGTTFDTAVGPEGLNASAIKFGAQLGGANAMRNSGFELANFVLASTTATFTDNTGTPGWKAANWTTAPENTTESTTLSMATVTV